MLYVWVVIFTEDGLPNVFSSAEKAYDYMCDFIEKKMIYDEYKRDRIIETLDRLKEDYNIKRNTFGVQWSGEGIYCIREIVN